MLPKSRDNRIDYEVRMPKPPQPRRRGSMEFYEWITLLLFLMSLSASTTLHLDISGESLTVEEGTGGFVPYPDAVTAFFFLLLVVFDYDASKRYTKYSSQLLDQWQEDKIRLMNMETKAKTKRSEDDNSD